MNKHTEVWLGNQPLWHDRDMVTVGAIGVTVGFLIGYCALKIFC